MTREELEAFDKEQQEKGWMKNLIDLFPSGARWQEAFKIVVDKAMEAPLSSWGGLKLGESMFKVSRVSKRYKIAISITII